MVGQNKESSEGASLKNKMVSGAMWTFLDTFGGMIMSFVIGIFLARLLSPSEYGMIGMIAVFAAVANMFVNSGFSQALIRKTDMNEDDIQTTFWYSLGMSIFMYFCLFFIAPYVAAFYAEPRLTTIMRVTNLPILISAFSIYPNLIINRELKFNISAKVTYACTAISGIIAIIMAFSGFGVYSLVFQGIVSSIISVIVLNILFRWKIRCRFSSASFRYLWNFGNKLLASGVLETIYSNLYQVVIGRVYSSYDLGQYQRANGYNSIFSQTLTGTIQRVSFPTLSKLQNDPQRMRSAYRKLIKFSCMLSCAGCLCLAAMAKPLIVFLIGEKWLPCVEYMQIICFSALLYPVHALNLKVLQVLGRTDLFLKLEIVKKLVASTTIIFGIFVSIKAMLAWSVLTSFICFGVNAHYSKTFLEYSFFQQFKDILPFIFAYSLIGLSTWCLSFLQIPVLIILCLQVVTFLGLSVLYNEIFRVPEYFEFKEIIFNGLNRFCRFSWFKD